MNNFSSHLGYYIQEIARKTTISLNSKMKSLDLSYSQFRVINCLKKRGDLSQKEILEDIVVKPSTLSGLLDLLEKKTYIEKKVAKHDKRVRLVGLTTKGELIWEKSWKIVMEFEDITTNHIPKIFKDELLDYLKEMNNKI